MTSGVYGRLSQRDVNSLMTGVPFIDVGDGGGATRDEWARVARFVHRPYVFDANEWIGLAGSEREMIAVPNNTNTTGRLGTETAGGRRLQPSNTGVATQQGKQEALLHYSDVVCNGRVAEVSGGGVDHIRALMRSLIREEMNEMHTS